MPPSAYPFNTGQIMTDWSRMRSRTAKLNTQYISKHPRVYFYPLQGLDTQQPHNSGSTSLSHSQTRMRQFETPIATNPLGSCRLQSDIQDIGICFLVEGAVFILGDDICLATNSMTYYQTHLEVCHLRKPLEFEGMHPSPASARDSRPQIPQDTSRIMTATCSQFISPE